MKTGLSYDDVCLIPRCNNVESRLHPSVETQLTSGIPIQIPIVAANMDTVIGPDLYRVLLDAGSIPIFHRFYTPGTVMDLEKMVKDCGDSPYILSCGVGETGLQFVKDFVYKTGMWPSGVCVDVAHGHSQVMLETLKELRRWGMKEVIAGNVCTARAVQDLRAAGATAVKVGIGPGSACITRNVTAFGRAQFSAVLECAEMAQDMKIPVIADGGIKSSRELILALAAGASSVMIGGLFARCVEAAGKGKFRGQASAEFQQEFYGGVKEGTVPEGVAQQVELSYTAKELIDGLVAGLRSGMTYGGATTIEELQRKARFERVTPSYF